MYDVRRAKGERFDSETNKKAEFVGSYERREGESDDALRERGLRQLKHIKAVETRHRRCGGQWVCRA